MPSWAAGAPSASRARSSSSPSAGETTVSRTAVALGGHEMTVNDERARRDLGYRPVVSPAEGLEELRARLAEEPPAAQEGTA